MDFKQANFYPLKSVTKWKENVNQFLWQEAQAIPIKGEK